MAQSLVIVAMHESMTGRRRDMFTTDDWRIVCREVETHLRMDDRKAQR